MASQLTAGLVGIIHNRQPIMDGEEQATWESPNGVFYKWSLEIDGKNGSALSKDQDPWWKDGTSVLYTLETKDGGKYGFKAMKKPEGQDAKQAHIKEAYKDKPAFVSTYSDPILIKRFAMVKAQGLITWFLDEFGYEPPTLEIETENAKYFYEWLTKDVSSRDVINLHVDCMMNAIRHINAGKKTVYKMNENQELEPHKVGKGRLERFIEGDDKITAKLIKLADKFYAEIEKIK